MIAQALTPKSRSTGPSKGRAVSAFTKIRVQGETNTVNTSKGDRKRSTFEKRKSLTVKNVDPSAIAKLVETGKVERKVAKIGEWRMPSSRFRFYWEVFNFVLYTTNAFLIPSRIVFGSRGSVESEAITATALFIQCVFFFDLVLR
jgi:hypothetical protein